MSRTGRARAPAFARGVYERDTRNLRTFVDTDAPAVREWAEAIYESDAVRMAEFTRRGFREAMAYHSTG